MFNDSHPVVFYDIITINLFPSETQHAVQRPNYLKNHRRYVSVDQEPSSSQLQSLVIVYIVHNTGHFIMFYMITNIYNKKTKGPTLMEFFTATEKLKKFSCGCEQFH
jgi:hypothetical protein